MSELATWEIPFDAWKTTKNLSFSRAMNGETATWNVRITPSPLEPNGDFSCLYLRRAGENTGFWAMRTDGPLRLSHSQLSDSSVRMACADVLQNGKIARLTFLDARGELRCAGAKAADCFWICPDRSGGWNLGCLAPDFRVDWFVPFQLNAGEDVVSFINRPFQNVWQSWQRARKNPDSDLSFALNWAKLDEIARDSHLYSWPRCDWLRCKLEFEARLKDILLADETLWSGEENDWVLDVRARDNISLHSFEELWDEPSSPSSFALNAVERLWDFFKPFDDEALKHPCVARWQTFKNRYFQARATTPTMHERVEGMLSWRDFEERSLRSC